MSINSTSSTTNTIASTQSKNTDAFTNEMDVKFSYAAVVAAISEKQWTKKSFAVGEFVALDSLAYEGTKDGLYGLEDVQVAIDRGLLSGESLESAKKFIDAKAKLADNDTTNDAEAEKILTGAGFLKQTDGQWVHMIDGTQQEGLEYFDENHSAHVDQINEHHFAYIHQAFAEQELEEVNTSTVVAYTLGKQWLTDGDKNNDLGGEDMLSDNGFEKIDGKWVHIPDRCQF